MVKDLDLALFFILDINTEKIIEKCVEKCVETANYYTTYLAFSYTRATPFTMKSSVGQYAYRMKEIKSKGNIYLNRRYCRSRLKSEVYMHMWLVCCGSVPTLIISFILKGSGICTGLKNEGNIYCFPLHLGKAISEQSK